MSTNSYLELVNRRTDQLEIHALFVGPHLANAQKVFRRDEDPVKCQHAATPELALDMMMARAQTTPFDCVMIDMRHENDGSPLNVVAISAIYAANRVIILANPDKVESFRALTGVDLVLPAPVDPKVIISTIMESAPVPIEAEATHASIEIREPHARIEELSSIERAFDAELEKAEVRVERATQIRATTPSSNPHLTTEPKVKAVKLPVDRDVETRRSIPVAPVGPSTERARAFNRETVRDLQARVTKGFETSLSIAAKADRKVWQRFVPIANFVYKKLAIIVLSALFLAFLCYGAMIVFFMTSSSWALPFELARGHRLVEKVERDLSLMRLRQNQVKQDLGQATLALANAGREQRDGKLNLVLAERTVEQELVLHKAQQRDIKKQIGRLNKVLSDFRKLNGNNGFARDLKNAYKRRLITRKARNNGSLTLLDTMHRMASVENEISLKKLELTKLGTTLVFLNSLLEEIKQPELRNITSSGAELAHLARNVIETKNRTSMADKIVEASQQRLERYDNSLNVITTNINSLESTPGARAIHGPINVLFVPYTNTHNLTPGTPLYSCTFSIFWCSEVGVTGAPIEGETSSTHPLFGKPMRGSFVEAKFFDPTSATKELVHAGGAPLLF